MRQKLEQIQANCLRFYNFISRERSWLKNYYKEVSDSAPDKEDCFRSGIHNWNNYIPVSKRILMMNVVDNALNENQVQK